MTSFVNDTKHSSVFQNLIAHGKATILRDLENVRFTDVVFEDGTQLKDVTFAELVDATWAKDTKHSTSYNNDTKN